MIGCPIVFPAVSMTTAHHSYVVNLPFSLSSLPSYSQQQLYDVVSDVDQYHLFVPWCTYSRVLSTKIIQGASAKKDQGHTGAVTTVMKAELGVGFQAFRERYVSEVTCEKPRKVKVGLRLRPSPPYGCIIVVFIQHNSHIIQSQSRSH